MQMARALASHNQREKEERGANYRRHKAWEG